MSIKKKIFDTCKQAAKSGELVYLSGYPANLLHIVRRFVVRYNAQYPASQCEADADKELDAVFIQTSDASVEDSSESQTSGLAIGAGLDAPIVEAFRNAMQNDYFTSPDITDKRRAKVVISKLNATESGDVVVRSSAGRLCFYRSSWLGKRNFYAAVWKLNRD